MKLCISFPRKTFLTGEYAVMGGAPALLVNTSPRFRFYVQKSKKSFHPFHKESPACLFIEKNKQVFSSVSIKYEQAYASGFGLSGAEFNCVYLLKVLLEGGSIKDISCLDILDKYISLFAGGPCLRRGDKESRGDKEGRGDKRRFREEGSLHLSRHSCEGEKPLLPSGADLVSQWLGKFCIFSKPSTAESIDWPFKNLSFALIQTGENLKTWKHLENLKQTSFSQLKEISLKALEAFRSSSESLFLQSIKDFRKELERQGLAHPSTKKILQKLDAHPEMLASKGCGAMGAEVLCVFFEKNENLDFLKDYKVISSLKDLDQGVLVDEL